MKQSKKADNETMEDVPQPAQNRGDCKQCCDAEVLRESLSDVGFALPPFIVGLEQRAAMM